MPTLKNWHWSHCRKMKLKSQAHLTSQKFSRKRYVAPVKSISRKILRDILGTNVQYLRAGDKKQTKAPLTSREEANMTGISAKRVRKQNLHLETCTTYHFYPHPERSESVSSFTGHEKSISGNEMEIVEKGSVVSNCKLSSGYVSPFCMNDVLYVPIIQHAIFPENKLDLDDIVYVMVDLKFVFLKVRNSSLRQSF